ncbi:MAG: VOC family protein [Anaerolineales bacterium]|jgi:methylmalonyl-CoA/ethylmalonyl-CoA epimerase
MDEPRSDAIGLTGLGQIAVSVEDVERSIRFYRDVLGLPFLFQAEGLAFFDLDGVRLMLAEPESPDDPKHASVLYFKAPNLESKVSALDQAGVEFAGAPHVVHKTDSHELWMAFFYDPDRHLMALMEERPKV